MYCDLSPARSFMLLFLWDCWQDDFGKLTLTEIL